MLEEQIQGMVGRETRAWDAQDTEALASIFRPDMPMALATYLSGS